MSARGGGFKADSKIVFDLMDWSVLNVSCYTKSVFCSSENIFMSALGISGLVIRLPSRGIMSVRGVCSMEHGESNCRLSSYTLVVPAA